MELGLGGVMQRRMVGATFLAAVTSIGTTLMTRPQEKPPHSTALRVVLAGMVHGHVDGFLAAAVKRNDIEIVGVAEPDRALFDMYAKKYALDAKLYHADLEEMLNATHPGAVLVYTNTFDHRRVVETSAKYAGGTQPGATTKQKPPAVMVEKPLAVSAEDAHAIARAAEEVRMPVLVNYVTTWAPSSRGAYNVVHTGEIGEVRKLVAHNGHKGPKEIGVGPEFLGWLTDPKLNGGGALYDFGCYGADFMTWLMNGKRPLTVTAVTQQIKPEIYPKVDDEATIVLTYPKAQAIIQASWNWPFDRKDMEIYGRTGHVITVKRDDIRLRRAGEDRDQQLAAKSVPAPYDDELSYLWAVIQQGAREDGLSSLDTNVTVTEILAGEAVGG